MAALLNMVCCVILLLIVTVFVSGCSDTGISGPAVVTTPAPPIVDSPVLTSPPPPPATILPAATGSGNEKFMDGPTTPARTAAVEDPAGMLLIHIRAGGSVTGLTVFIASAGTDIPPVDYHYLPDGTVTEGPNTGYLRVVVLPDGKSEYVQLAPGSYTAYLPNRNVGQPPEEQQFTIQPKDITHIWFEGFSASSGGCCGG